MDYIKTFEEKNWMMSLRDSLSEENGQKITKSEIEREISNVSENNSTDETILLRRRIVSNLEKLKDFKIESINIRDHGSVLCIRFVYKDMEFILTYKILEENLTTLEFLPTCNVLSATGKGDGDTYILIFSSDEIDESILKNLDLWISRYNKFMGVYSDGHIDDMLNDLNNANIEKSLRDHREIKGWLSTLEWFVTIDLTSKVVTDNGQYLKTIFTPNDLVVISDFILRMESFGFEFDCEVYDNTFCIYAKKNL